MSEVAKRKVVVRGYAGKFESKNVSKCVGDKHGTSLDNGFIDNKKVRNQGELMSHNRTIYVHKCEICPNTFEGVATAKFCSNACRQKAKRLKKTMPQIGMVCEWKRESHEKTRGKILNVTKENVIGVFDHGLAFDWSYDKFLADFKFWIEL